jgi:hypothetical protein
MSASSRSVVVRASSSAWRAALDLDDARQQVRKDRRVVGITRSRRRARLSAASPPPSAASAPRQAEDVARRSSADVVDDDLVGLGLLASAASTSTRISRTSLVSPPARSSSRYRRTGGWPRRPALGPGLVTDLVLERRHVGDEVGLALLVDGVDREPAGRGGQQVVAAVG